MRYQGRKKRVAPQIAELLAALATLSGAPRIEELCCGSASVSAAMFDQGVVVDAIGDDRPALISCLQHLRDGWVPPTTLTPEEYATIRERCPDDTATDPLAAFALLFCSHGGAWSGGYIHDDLRWSGERSGGASRSAAAAAHRDMVALVPFLRRVGSIWCGDYRSRDLERPPGTVIFIDPPYAGTKPYKGRLPFDHAGFWAWAREVSRRHLLVVTEDTVPDGWRLALDELVESPGMRDAYRRERGWVLEGGLADQLMRAHPTRAAFALGQRQLGLAGMAQQHARKG